MKKQIFLILVPALLFVTGCDKRLEAEARLEVRVESADSYLKGDTIVVRKATDIRFIFDGNPDFITFYSGEPGREYSKRNLTEVPVDQITSALEFSTFAQYGTAATVAGSLKVFLSAEFTGMVKNNKAKDSISILTTNWVDITAQCSIPQVPGTGPRVSIPLNEYLGKRLTVAFLYNTTDNSAAQPVWEIYDLKVVNTDKTTGSVSSINASAMGFVPLDMMAAGNAAYNTVSNNTSGIWNLSNIAAAANPRIRMHSSSAGAPLNTDWLVSNPFLINARTPDAGTGIKTVTNRLDNYTHQYDRTGTYAVTIVGRNSNFEAVSEVVREVLIKVVE